MNNHLLPKLLRYNFQFCKSHHQLISNFNMNTGIINVNHNQGWSRLDLIGSFRQKSTIEVHYKELSDFSDSTKAQEAKRNIYDKDPYKYTLQKHGYGNGVLEECPDLLSIPHTAIENYIIISRESGFSHLKPQFIATFPTLAKKKINNLRKVGFIPDCENVLGNYFKLLQLTNEIQADILSNFSENYNEYSLMDVRLIVLEHFLAHALEETIEASRGIIHKYPRCKYRCFTWYLRNFDILRNQLQFSNKMIFRHGYLLQGNPDNSESILNSIDTLGGRPLLEILTRRPKILMTDVENILRSKSLLQEYGMTDEAVAKYPEIFTLSSSTIEKRLKALNETPELLPLKAHPRVGRVIYYFTKVQKRLSYLDSIDISGVSLHILSSDTKHFSNYVQTGELKNKGTDLIHFLSHSLNITKKQVRKNLLVHPHWLQVPTKYVKEVLLLLLDSFSKEQIVNALPILLYPKETLEREISNAKAEGDQQMSHPAYLHLLLYKIEKEFHFTGDGIWTTYHSLRTENQSSSFNIHKEFREQ